ncbi:MAG: LysM peptidoglycan-binding domain-containing M23 family metallopeptidase [Bauldia sp.]|nr:LysM peptidoglycan-binding domain-containing M23 family metallopeptidase [Bauldia sp.]
MTVGAVALLSGFTAACSSPMTTGATGPAPGAVSGQPMPPALVGTNPIANGQPTGYAAGTVNGPGAGATDVQVAALPPPTGTPATGAAAPLPAAATGTSPANYAATAGGTITAQPGDTLYSLGRQYGVTPAAIAAANGLTQTSTLTIGQRLVIPSPNSPAGLAAAPLGNVPTAAGTPGAMPVPSPTPAAAPVRTAAVTQTPGQHVVQTGETIYSIATGYGISPNALMQANGMAQAEFLRVGTTLTIPDATRAPATTPSAPATVAAAPIPAPVATPTPAPAPAPVATPAPAPAAAAPQQTAAVTTTGPAATAPSTNGTTFRWPLQGRVISDFGPKPGGERNDGINLAAPEGTDIRAAEAGTVIYAGNEIPGYGNLILIRHADNFVTAYAHTSAMLVAKDQTVSRGQVIGRVGQTGSVTSPQLHFELRRGSTPINPLDYLTN